MLFAPAIGATGLSDGPRAADDGQLVVHAAGLELRGAGHIRDIGQPDAGQGRQQLIPQAARAASGSIHIWRPLRNSVGATHASPLRHASSTPPGSTELDSGPVSSTGQALRRNDGGFCKGLYMRVAAAPSGTAVQGLGPSRPTVAMPPPQAGLAGARRSAGDGCRAGGGPGAGGAPRSWCGNRRRQKIHQRTPVVSSEHPRAILQAAGSTSRRTPRSGDRD